MVFQTEAKSYHFPLEKITVEALGENHNWTKMLKLVPPNATVVDFGCSAGYFAQLLNQHGCRVVGVEIDPKAAQAAQQHCIQVITADLDFVAIPQLFPNPVFDVAVFGDVLEHLRNPLKALVETRRILKPNGRVVACIPNVAHGAVRLALLQGRFDYTPVGILDDTHLRFFTRKTMFALFQQAGYHIEALDRVVVPMFADTPIIPRVRQEDFPPGLIQQLMRMEDTDTLQFILRAVPIL